MTKKRNITWKFLKLNGELNRAYKVSNYGDIVNSKTMKPLKQYNMGKKCPMNGTDYKSVSIIGQKNMIRVHRIVCETFHGTPKGDRTIVEHKDERKNNNAATNLKWVTSAENSQAYFSKHTVPRFSSSVVSKVKKLLNRGLSNDAIAQKVRMSDSNVSSIKLGYTHTYVKPYTADQIELGNC